MSLGTLEDNGLYILLFLRNSPHEANNFHWALYLHHGSQKGGVKYHAKTQGSGWITDHGLTRGVEKEFLLVGLFQIAAIHEGWETYVDQQIRTYDASLNYMPGVTCRVWLFSVLELLQKEVDGYKVLKCEDLEILEDEINAWGNQNAASAEVNEKPRPVGVSKFL